jgi:hypothetical protein
VQKFVTTVLMGLLIFGARTAWRIYAPDESSADDTAAYWLEEDEYVEESFSGADSAQARGWLATPGNVVIDFEEDRKVNALVEQLYAAGATDVRFMRIEKYESENSAGSLAARLPADPAARARVLRVHDEYSAQYGGEGLPDVGQRFVEFPYDL